MTIITYMENLKKRVWWMIVSLSTQFVLGMLLNLFGQPPDSSGVDHNPLWVTIAFAAHGILGLGLLIGAIIIFNMASKLGDKLLKNAAMYGLLSILLAASAGVLTVVFGEQKMAEVASFMMASGFLLSILSYGRLFVLLRGK